jgi:hypothetical protein
VDPKGLTFQFRVALKGVRPEVWRRIQVPARYSFWDLHVAIQDAMGWLDRHLHAFQVLRPDTGETSHIGIPDEDPIDLEDVYLPGWEIPLAEFFAEPGARAEYEYDFGDRWMHEVVLEEVLPRVPERRYPVCVDGARAFPPEGCGGGPGYERLLRALGGPKDERHEELSQRAGRAYDPAAFDAVKVRFDNPKLRWRRTFADGGSGGGGRCALVAPESGR